MKRPIYANAAQWIPKVDNKKWPKALLVFWWKVCSEVVMDNLDKKFEDILDILVNHHFSEVYSCGMEPHYEGLRKFHQSQFQEKYRSNNAERLTPEKMASLKLIKKFDPKFDVLGFLLMENNSSIHSSDMDIIMDM